MELRVLGKAVDRGRISYNDHMNFGQRGRWSPSSLFDFQMMIPRGEFVEKFAGLYDAARQDMLAEFKAFPSSFDETDGFFAMGFIESLNEAFAFPEALAEVVDTFLVWDHSSEAAGNPSCILDAYFSPGWSGQVIDGVAEVIVDAQGVTLKGFMHRGKPVRRDP